MKIQILDTCTSPISIQTVSKIRALYSKTVGGVSRAKSVADSEDGEGAHPPVADSEDGEGAHPPPFRRKFIIKC
jgi:hypothetical protein